MSPRTLKIALVASAALNLFAVAAAVTVFLGGFWVDQKAKGPRDGHRPPSMSAVDGLDPAIREGVRSRLRAVASTTREDFSAAREARRSAIQRIEQGQWDRAELAALLTTSREAEMRGRATLENGALEIIEDLEPADRARMAVLLNRHRDRDGKRGGGKHGEPKADAPAESR